MGRNELFTIGPSSNLPKQEEKTAVLQRRQILSSPLRKKLRNLNFYQNVGPKSRD